MTITRNVCFCDNPDCRASTPVAAERFADWETVSEDGVVTGVADAHLCERCSGRRTAGQSLDFTERLV
jgi:hypothetical protein